MESLLGGLLALFLLTSFAKVFTVLSIVKVGAGLEGAGMGAIVAGVALLVSAASMQTQWEPIGGLEGVLRGQLQVSQDVLRERFQPFLRRNADPALITRIQSTIDSNQQDSTHATPETPSTSDTPPIQKKTPESFAVVALAFLITELREALELGLLFLLPFVVIDLLVVNVLMSLGITSISARVVSLPLKLLLFVSVDGWTLIVDKLVGGYVS